MSIEMFIMSHLAEVELLAPAKVNLFLGVTGLRADGYHSIVSWVAPLAFGDVVRVELQGKEGSDVLTVEGVRVDCSVQDNLAWSALLAFRRFVPDLPFVRISLIKRIPFGAGLGGGSSDAVAVIKGLNLLCGGVLGPEELLEATVSLGADCPLFLEQGTSIIRGNGALVDPLLREVFPDKRLLLFKPFLGVNTAWAYGRLREQQHYLEPQVAEERLQSCVDSFSGQDFLFYNSFEAVVFETMPGLKLLIDALRSEGVACGLSGSGSACFAIVKDDTEAACIRNRVNACWGGRAFIVETCLLS